MAKNINRASTPVIDQRPETDYLGIRIQTPFRGMFRHIDAITKELANWFMAQAITPAGPPFLRYHVIDMQGEMDMEYAIPVEAAMAGDERIRPATLPAGRYVSLIYSGSGMQGNKALIEWARAHHLQFDRWDNEKGDVFRARYERYLTDPKIEHRKTLRDVEVAIKLADV
jgi:effector-binding domain-containing protein